MVSRDSSSEKDTQSRPDAESVQNTTVAAVDIGSNSIRLAIADIMPDGSCKILERAKQPVALGHDTFINSKIARQTISSAIAVLTNYKKLIDEYRANHTIAVATSAVREAANSDIFLARIARAVGFTVRLIEPAEEGRLTVAAVLNSMKEQLAASGGLKAIMEVGGGSTWFTVLDHNGVVASESYDMGSIRVQEFLNTFQERPEYAVQIIRHHVTNMVSIINRTMPLAKINCLIAVGGDVRIAADLDRTNTRSRNMPLKEFDKVVSGFLPLTPVQIAKNCCIPFSDAETLVPALLTYQAMAKATAATEIVVSSISLRDGLLWNFSQRFTGSDDRFLVEGVAQSARAIGEKYHYDGKHAEKVAQFALELFDVLAAEHGFGPRQRTLLHVAALLHDIGDFVSRRAHHKHSYYLILNSEVFGLRRDEMILVAHVARYHRRSVPKPSHLEYAVLESEKRVLISKLAAILRVADALDRNRQQNVKSIKATVEADGFRIQALTSSEIETGTAAMKQKLIMMEETYGLQVRIEQVIIQDERPG